VSRALRVALVAGLALVAGSFHAQNPNDADLERVRGEISRLRERLEDLRTKTRSVEREIEEVNLELDIRTRELRIAVSREAALAERQKQMEGEVGELTRRIAEQKAFLARRLVALYRLGSLSYVRVLLSMEEKANPIEAMSMLTYVVGRDSRAVTRFEESKAELGARQRQLADQQVQLQESRRVVEERRQAVLATFAQKQRKLEQLRREESGSELELARLEEKAVRLERLVTILIGQQAGITLPSLDIRTVQGALEWPVQGKILESFGRHRNPKFATYTMNNGLKIAADPGEPVRAVFQGTVLFSQWFKGYGNLIIVDHGNRVFSLYGNLKAPAIQVGDRVATGQTLAGVGEAEDAQSYLYFEVRNDNRPEDPQKWLR
jgi:septal ring factor EnvC (AmiA/AmiB activator)